jgi:hypothetical protein
MARIGRVRGEGPGLPDLVAVTVQGSPKGPSGAPTCAARSVGGAYRNGGDRRQTRQPSPFPTRIPPWYVGEPWHAGTTPKKCIRFTKQLGYTHHACTSNLLLDT